jgi:UDP-N-acetylmuramate: L-alanyl-gamma-D-glutamyl-meso-diaminopimelate ligase
VRVTLEALRATRPERRLIAVFEPRSNTSRRRIFQDQYANSFGAAEVVVLCEVFAKGGAALPDKLDVPRLVTQIQQQNKTAFYAEDYAAVRELLARTMRPGDQVVFLSNGGFGDLPRNTLAYLQESGGA